jgi:hypothetical protein
MITQYPKWIITRKQLEDSGFFPVRMSISKMRFVCRPQPLGYTYTMRVVTKYCDNYFIRMFKKLFKK